MTGSRIRWHFCHEVRARNQFAGTRVSARTASITTQCHLLAEKVIWGSARKSFPCRTSTNQSTCATTRSNASTQTAATGTLRCRRTICGTRQPSRNTSSTIRLRFHHGVMGSNLAANETLIGLRGTIKCGTSWFIREWSRVWLVLCWPVKKPWIAERTVSNFMAPTLWSWRISPSGWSRSTVILIWAIRAKSPRVCVDRFWRTP